MLCVVEVTLRPLVEVVLLLLRVLVVVEVFEVADVLLVVV